MLSILFGLSLALASASAAPAPLTPSAGAAVPADTGHLDAGDGIRLYYFVLGGAHRDTIVLVHGGPGLSSSYLQRDLDFVAARHTVLLYDQRGSGRSTLVDDSTKISMALHVADLDAVPQPFSHLARESVRTFVGRGTRRQLYRGASIYRAPSNTRLRHSAAPFAVHGAVRYAVDRVG